MKTAFITGASSGIGSAVVNLFKKNNWEVIAPSRQELDLSKPDLIVEKLDSIVKDDLSAIIHIAGVWHTKDGVIADQQFRQFKPDQVIDTVNVGLTSFMVIVNKLLPKLKENGVVIGISGTFSDGAAGWLPYYTSKRALEDFIAGLSQDSEVRFRTFGISPADTSTPAYNKFYPEYSGQAQSPEVVAELCLQLVDGKTGFNTGKIIEIRDGKASEGFHK